MKLVFLAILLLAGCSTMPPPVPQRFTSPPEIIPPPISETKSVSRVAIVPFLMNSIPKIVPITRTYWVTWTNREPDLYYEIWFSTNVLGPYAMISTNTSWTGTNYIYGPLRPGFTAIVSASPTVLGLTSCRPPTFSQ